MVSRRKFYAITALILAAALCAVLYAQSRPAEPSGECVTVSFTAPLSAAKPVAVVVAPGTTFSVTIPSNRTTGYGWKIGKQPDARVFKNTGSDYNAPNTGLIGAGGTETWTFQAVAKGKSSVRLDYVRPWEKGIAPIKTQTVNVTVQ